MKKINFLTVLLTALLVSGSAWAGNQAKIVGGDEYATLTDAIAAVPTTGVETEIQLLEDIEFDKAGGAAYTISGNRNVVLDLNGKKIVYNNTAADGAMVILNNAILTIDDKSVGKDGFIELKGLAKFGGNQPAVCSSKKLTINGGAVYNSLNGNYAAYAVDLHPANVQVGLSELFINGGTIGQKSWNHPAIRCYGRDSNGSGISYAITMTGGKVFGQRGFYLSNKAEDVPITLTISGGEIEAKNGVAGEDYRAIDSQIEAKYNTLLTTINISGDVVIKGFVILSNDQGSGARPVAETVSITGGDFQTNDGIRIGAPATETKAEKFITGGKFFFSKAKNLVLVMSYIQFDCQDAKGKYARTDDLIYARYTGDLATKEGWEALGFTLQPVAAPSVDPEGTWYSVWKNNAIAANLTEFNKLLADNYAAEVIAENEAGQTVKVVAVQAKPASAGGNWSDTQETWGGTKPNEGSEVSVAAGQTIVVDENASIYSLEVADGGKVEVEAGKTLTVGRGGVSGDDDQIIVKSDAEGTGVLLISPEADSESMPEATVELFTKARKTTGETAHNKWQYFACPISSGSFDFAEGNTETTYINYWDGGHFRAISSLEEVVGTFNGFCISTDRDGSSADGVKYEFKGQLVGNAEGEIKLSPGFRLLGNSYTAPMDIVSLLKGIVVENSQVSGSIWIYNSETENYEAISVLKAKKNNLKIAPLQSFMMYMESGEAKSVTAPISYTDVVWNNDKKQGDPLKAPARMMSNDVVAVDIVLSNADQRDVVFLYESNEYTADYENGADVRKLMNPFGAASLYASTEIGEMSDVATDLILGTKLSLKSGRATDYTISFENVEGEGYALKDNVTDQYVEIAEGNTYSFSVVANQTFANRFEIVDSRMMPTGMQKVEEVKAVKGIFTTLGQPVGDLNAWEALPAGIYVVDGQKMAK